ncbi:SDR family oxidoreductase [uncultured Mailhella sp.]|uniref:SDR family NAD(P)-dependent oxidoreductase n=1 Tax=uncultured Mailhella sp. TaxID=1981031 RepID=UPI0025DF85A8|nr:SDR family oxidoreductase [uncultured Mailhella sp.]
MAKEGALVAITGRNQQRLDAEIEKIRAAGGKAIGMTFDMQDSAAITAFYDMVMKEWGRVDILVTTHGIFDQRRGSLEMTEKDFQKFMQINVISVFVLCNLVMPQMIERGKGVIIATASISGMRNTAMGGPRGSAGGGSVYTSSKHALVGYIRSLSALYAWQGVRANVICPGSVVTPFIQDSLDNDPDGYEKRVRVIPAGRLGVPEDIAKVTAFLASDDAGFIHGAVIPVDGGRSNV